MAKLADSVPGTVFGKLTVQAVYKKDRHWMATCLCECGNIKEVKTYGLGTNYRSCGCARIVAVKRALILRNTTHGLRHTVEYLAWANMWQRTTNKLNGSYPSYKDRAPPQAWRDFAVFMRDMGPKPKNHSLERIDNDKPYGPDNCKWATQLEQANNKASTYRISFDGTVYSISGLAKHLGIKYGHLNHRFVTKKEELSRILKVDPDRVKILRVGTSSPTNLRQEIFGQE